MNDMEVRRSDNESPPNRGRARAQIRLHDATAFAGMRKAGRMAAELLDYITPYVRPGISTGEVDRLCHDFVSERGGVSAPLGYRGYPRSVCTSVNHVVCHGKTPRNWLTVISSTSMSPPSSTAGTAIRRACFMSASPRSRPGVWSK